MTLSDRQIRFIKFLFVGALNTVFGYSVYALTLSIDGHYTVAVAVSMILGVLFNFKTTGRLVFGARGNGRFPQFIGVYAFIYLYNISVIWALEQVGVNAYIAGLINILPQAVLSYALISKFVFVTKAV